MANTLILQGADLPDGAQDLVSYTLPPGQLVFTPAPPGAPVVNRIVARHSIPAGAPTELPLFGQTFSGYTNPYGWEYPLFIQPPLVAETSAQKLARYQAVRVMGTDILSVDVLQNIGFMSEPLAYCAEAGLLCAPCFDFTSLTGNTSAQNAALLVTMATAYAGMAAGSPSAARTPTGALIFFDYSHASIAAADRAATGATLAAMHPPVTFFQWGDVSAGLTGSALTAYMAAQLTSLDGAYVFGTKTAEDISTILASFAGLTLPWGLSAQPGLDRTGGGYIDPQGTLHFRTDCEQLLSTAAAFPALNTLAHFTTLDDSAEKTWDCATSSWMQARADIAAVYAARWKGKSWPFGDARIYVTVPSKVYDGHPAVAEGYVINPTGRALHLSVNILTPFGQGVAATRIPIAPYSFGLANASQISLDPAALQAVQTLVSSSGLSYATCYCTLTDDVTGQTIATNGGAPIFFPRVTPPSGFNGRTRYLSTASNGYLGNLGVQYIGRYGSPGAYTYGCYLNKHGAETPSFIEIIKDGSRQWQQFYNVLPQGGSAPGNRTPFTPWSLAADDDGDETDYGCRYVREIALVGGVWSVAYSMPQRYN